LRKRQYQVGIEPSTLKLAQIESFVGNNKSWHLIFDFLAFPLSMKITKGPSLLDAQWFEIDKPTTRIRVRPSRMGPLSPTEAHESPALGLRSSN